MVRFRFKAVAPTGSIVEGEMEAAGRTAAIERLRELRHLPVRVDEVDQIEPVADRPPALEPERRVEPKVGRAAPSPGQAEPEARIEPLIERLSLDASSVSVSMDHPIGVVVAPPPTDFDRPPGSAGEAEEPPLRPLRWDLGDDRSPALPTEETAEEAPPADSSQAPEAEPYAAPPPEAAPDDWIVGEPQHAALEEAPPDEALRDETPEALDVPLFALDVGTPPPAPASPESSPRDEAAESWEAWRPAGFESPTPESAAPDTDAPDSAATGSGEPPARAVDEAALTLDRPLESFDWSVGATEAARPAADDARPEPVFDVKADLPLAAGGMAAAPGDERAEPRQAKGKGKAKSKSKAKGGKATLPAKLAPVFTRELQVLLAAGLPMDRALRIIVEATADDRVAAAADALLARVRGGALLSEAMEEMPDRFDEFLRTAVRAGEAGGALAQVLDQVATYQERSQRLARSVRSALIYPSILAFASALSVILLLTVVVPQFEVLFRQSGQAPPWATQLVIRASILLRQFGWAIPAALATLWIVLRWRYADARRGLFLHRRVLGLPVIGPVVSGVSVERFARALGTLLANGVGLPEALGLVANAVPNRAVGTAAASAVERVKQGERLADALEEAGSMPLLAVQLIRVGEESGRLVEMLARLADIYAGEVDTAVKRLTGLIEPTLILVIGVVVGGIVLALLSAIAGLNALAL